MIRLVSTLLIFRSPFSGVQTPNCIRQTVFDAVALDYHEVTVIVDATAAATPDVHIGNSSKTILNYLLCNSQGSFLFFV